MNDLKSFVSNCAILSMAMQMTSGGTKEEYLKTLEICWDDLSKKRNIEKIMDLAASDMHDFLEKVRIVKYLKENS